MIALARALLHCGGGAYGPNGYFSCRKILIAISVSSSDFWLSGVSLPQLVDRDSAGTASCPAAQSWFSSFPAAFCPYSSAPDSPWAPIITLKFTDNRGVATTIIQASALFRYDSTPTLKTIEVEDFEATLFALDEDVLIMACVLKYGVNNALCILPRVYAANFPNANPRKQQLVQSRGLLTIRYREIMDDEPYVAFLLSNLEYLSSVAFTLPDEHEAMRQVGEAAVAENRVADEISQRLQAYISARNCALPRLQSIEQIHSYSMEIDTSCNVAQQSHIGDTECSGAVAPPCDEDAIFMWYLLGPSSSSADVDPVVGQFNQQLNKLNMLKDTTIKHLEETNRNLYENETRHLQEQFAQIECQTVDSVISQHRSMLWRAVQYYEENSLTIGHFAKQLSHHTALNRGLIAQLQQLNALRAYVFALDTVVPLLLAAKALQIDSLADQCCQIIGQNILDHKIAQNKQMTECSLIFPADFERVMQSVSDMNVYQLYLMILACEEEYKLRMGQDNTYNPLSSRTRLDIGDLERSQQEAEIYKLLGVKTVPVRYIVQEALYRRAQLRTRYSTLSASEQARLVLARAPFHELLMQNTESIAGEVIARGDGYTVKDGGKNVIVTAQRRLVHFHAAQPYVFNQSGLYLEIYVARAGENTIQLGLRGPRGCELLLSNNGILYYEHMAHDCPAAAFTDGDIVQFTVNGPAARVHISKNGTSVAYGPQNGFHDPDSQVTELLFIGNAYVYSGEVEFSINFAEPYILSRPDWIEPDK